VFNLGNPEELRIADLARLVIGITGSSSEIVFRERPADDPDRRRPDISKAKRVLGWEPRTGIREGLRKTVAWFREKLIKAGELQP